MNKSICSHTQIDEVLVLHCLVHKCYGYITRFIQWQSEHFHYITVYKLYLSYGPKQLQTRDSSFCKGVLVCEMKYANFARLEHKTDQTSETEKELSSLVVDALSPCVILVRIYYIIIHCEQQCNLNIQNYPIVEICSQVRSCLALEHYLTTPEINLSPYGYQRIPKPILLCTESAAAKTFRYGYACANVFIGNIFTLIYIYPQLF